MMPAGVKIESFSRIGTQSADEATQPESLGDAGPAPDVGRGTVLVVDDEPAIVALLSEYLDIQGFTVVTAGGGLEALGRLETDRPDAVLLDVRMPDMDGIETLKRIVARQTRVPVLMVSANDDLRLAKEAIALGAFDYILKPIDFGYLSRALEQMTRLPGLTAQEGTASSDPGPLSPYHLALTVCRVTRAMSPASRRSVGIVLERIALGLVRRGPGGERR